MEDENKTKTQLISELVQMRRKVFDLEKTLDRFKHTEKELQESEERFKNLSNLTFEGILIHKKGVVQDLNLSLANMVDYRREELLGKNIIDMLIPDEYHRIITENILQNRTKPYRVEGIRKDGSRIPIELESRYVDGEYRVTAVRDITGRVKAEQALKQAAKEWQTTFDSVTDGICLLDAEQKILRSNKTMEVLFPEFRGRMTGRNCWEVVHKKKGPIRDCPVTRMQRTLQRESMQFVLGERIMEVTVDPIIDASDSLLGAVHLMRDITERKHAKKALEASEAEYKALFEGINDAAFVHHFQHGGFGNFIKVNDIACKKLGYTREELLRMSPKDISVPEDARLRSSSREQNKLLKDRWAIFEAVHVAKSGRRIPVEISSRIFELGGRPVIMSLARDISERRQAEVRMQESEERFRLAFHTSPDSITISRLADGTYLDINEGFTKITGYTREDAIGKSALEINIWDEPNERRYFVKALKENGIINNLEVKFRHKNGRTLHGLMSASVMRLNDETVVLSIARDITERKRIEEERARLEVQLRRAQRLETIGTLAGGIAHDFNNILAPIMGFTELALLKIDKNESVTRDLQQVLKSSRRAKDLVEQILLFSKQSEREQKPLALQPLVKEALKLLRPSIPATIEIRSELSASCGRVRADATQMHQVVINLCTNAWQAMDESGTLRIELQQVSVDATTVKMHPNLNTGEYARLSVMDTGRGMDEATLDRVFEPFFTTKTVNEGTGLGLSVVHGIVRNHRGDILVDSEPGKGAAFHIYLPIIQDDEEPLTERSEAIFGGTERVLIVDDEAVIAEMVKTMLERFGYETDVFNSGIAAAEAFEAQPGRYDLLISDLTMPHMTGLDLADKLHGQRPDLPVIIMTGFGDSLTDPTLRRYGVRQVIGKPVLLQELAAAVRKVLDER
jgi:PAS domain S-box-containing protein